MSKQIDNDTKLYCYAQFISGDDYPTRIDRFTTTLGRMEEVSKQINEPFTYQIDIISEIAESDTEEDFLWTFCDATQGIVFEKVKNHLLEQGWTGFETDDFSVCIAPNKKLSKNGFETLYQYE